MRYLFETYWPCVTGWVGLSLVCLTFEAGLSQDGQNQEKPSEVTPMPTAKIAELKWIAGHWQGEALGGRFEETWNPPLGETMVGMFKSLNGEKVNFYEILTIGPKGNSLALRLKHFDPQLVGWEEKDRAIEFPLVSVSEKEAKFDGLVFRKLGPDKMQIMVQVESSGQKSKLVFNCYRVKPDPAASP